MCKETSENKDEMTPEPNEDAAQVQEAATTAGALSAELTTTKETGDDAAKSGTTTVERFPWWRGGGIKPQTGRDLGVFEESLEDRANVVAQWTVTYLNPLLSLGSRKVLDSGDVGVPSRQDRSERAYQTTREAWEARVRRCHDYNEQMKEQHAAKLNKCKTDAKRAKIKEPVAREPSIAGSLFASFGKWTFVLAIIYQVISSMLSFVPVIILNELVKYFEWYNAGLDPKEFESRVPPWVAVAGLGIIPLLVSALQTRHNTIMAHCGVFVRTAVSTMLYRKALTVSAAARAKTSTGQVVNMMSNGA
jgi:hypothetical protein